MITVFSRVHANRTDLPGNQTQQHPRCGAIVVIFAMVLVLLLGLLGLVIDGGFLLSTHRQVYNVADAAALAYAMEKLVGESDETALAAANTYVQTYNGMANATLLVDDLNVHNPPVTGPHAGLELYVELRVTFPQDTLFIHILGIDQTQQISARAVATWGELLTAGEGAIVLDPREKISPGFDITGGGTIKVEGGIIDNNEGGGVDENGEKVWPLDPFRKPVAASGGQPNDPTGGIFTTSFRVTGGVDKPELFKNFFTGTNVPNILHAGVFPTPDPLATLPTPYVGNGVIYPVATSDGTWGQVAITQNNFSGPVEFEIDDDGDGITDRYELKPGVYKRLQITGNVGSPIVTFLPGIFVIKANNVNALSITGGAITANGIMIYNTGSNYDPMTGVPDNSDPYDPLGLIPPPGNPDAQFGDVTLNAATEMRPIDTSNLNYTYPAGISVFDGMLFFQRRMNDFGVEIQGESSASILAGTIYGKWAKFKISGNGKYDAQFIVGSMLISGNGEIIFEYAGQGRGKAPAVFLVE